jgi:microcystin-dependent protein
MSYTPYSPTIVDGSTDLLAAQLNYLEVQGIKPLHDDADAAAMPCIVVQYAGATVPYGWLACTGQAVSRTTYSRLFAIIGTKYGSGDGINTFNVPDYRGYFIRGLDEGRGLDLNRTLGSSQADDNVLHSHTSQDSPAANNLPGNSGGVDMGAYTQTTDATVTAESTGTEFRPVNYSCIYIIKS